MRSFCPWHFVGYILKYIYIYIYISLLTLMLDNKNWQTNAKSKNVNFYMKIKKRIITRYCFVSTNTFQRVMIYILLDIVDIWPKKGTHICKKDPQGLHLTGMIDYAVVPPTSSVQQPEILGVASHGLAALQYSASNKRIHVLTILRNTCLGGRYRNPILANVYVQLYIYIYITQNDITFHNVVIETK